MINRELVFNPTNAQVLMLSFLISGGAFVLVGLQQSLQNAEVRLRPALKVVAFLPSSLQDDLAKQWANQLRASDSEIQSVLPISKEEALAKAQADPSLSKALLLLRENPLPASVVLQYSDMAWLERPEPAVTLKTMPEVQELRWDPQARTHFRSLRQWRLWVTRVSAFGFMMCLVWSFFGIYRYLVLKARTSLLFVQLGVGLLGSGLALFTGELALQRLGVDAAVYKPETVSFWPLACGVMAALAIFGWRVSSHD